MAYGEISGPRPETGGKADPREANRLAEERTAAILDYEVLDSEPEEAFEEIVFMARTVCKTPTALISLVDEDRQWFKARLGFDACETPIEQSVCAKGMHSTELLVIPDLSVDERTCDNALVTCDKGARFYAGAPLVTPSGTIIGMLCVLDQQPRPAGLDPAQRRILKALAGQVVDQLELRKALRQAAREVELHRSQTEVLERTSKRLQLAEEAGNIGAFELDIETRRVKVSPEFCRIHGFDNVDVLDGADIGKLRKVPLETRIEDQGIADADGQFSNEYEIIRANDGAVRWVEMRARVVPADGENGATLVGIVTDVTEQHAVNEEIAHRLKNTLALVQAVAGHTLRGVTDPEPVREFNRRIAAMSTAHDLLLSRSSASGRIHELASSVFDKLGIEQRVEVTGCDCMLSSRSVLTLSMILHELGTNAMKYGALSVPDGQVVLHAFCEPDAEGESQLTLSWTENGGPPAQKPERRGLGTRLIERGVDPEGEVTMDFGETGLRVVMTALLSNIGA
ncbi:HWE histidine kinase domain-containing protein [Croceicoccus mobilis]|uniref:histidine kinase n=1 Tax=Croceicoccus mobilis TaxID=1703339 RepID=A0A917DQM7_9SPHN|nr:HWE histidine kinase domain-containing protein [Croceicoccus mobilis]GGD61570.1 histidine kinase [Croceicoccus mobilis]